MVKNITPEWEDFLNIAAACMLDKQFKHWVYLVGPGGTGLSRLVKILTHIVGKDSICTTPTEMLKKNQFAAKDLVNAKLLINTEVEGNKVETEFVKKMTGGDALRGENKYGGSFPFYTACTPIFTTNDPPEPYSGGQDLGRRIIVITCTWFFVEEVTDPNHQKLLDPDTDAKIDNPENLSALINELLPLAQKILIAGEVPMKVSKGVAVLESLSHSVESFLDAKYELRSYLEPCQLSSL
jgi:phage/plasmid-associated DNA primase